MLNRGVVFATLLCALFFGSPVWAISTATFELGVPTVTSTKATFDVSVTLVSDDPTDFVDGLQISVFDSSPVLTDNNTDFSRFSFDIGTGAMATWDLFSAIDSGVGSYLDLTFVAGLSPGAHSLGRLSVSLAGITPGTSLFITLDGGSVPLTNTDAGGFVNSDVVLSFADTASPVPDNAFVEFAEPGGVSFTIIPEPLTATLGAMGLVMLGVGLRRRQRSMA